MWFNSLVALRRRQIDRSTGTTGRRSGPPADEGGDDHAARWRPRPRPTRRSRTAQEDQARLALRGGQRGVRGQLPVRVAERRRRTRPRSSRTWAARPARASSRASPRRVTIGGINIGVVGYSKHPTEAFDAPRPACATADNQKRDAIKGGLPPTLNALYDDPSLAKPYPFADLLREQLNGASVAAADAGLRGRLAGDLTRRSRRPTASTRTTIVTTLRTRSRTRWTRGRCCEQPTAPPGRGSATGHAEAQEGLTDRARAERKLGWLLVRAGGDRDAARHRLPDRLRVLPVAAALRPALPGRRTSSSASTTTATC